MKYTALELQQMREHIGIISSMDTFPGFGDASSYILSKVLHKLKIETMLLTYMQNETTEEELRQEAKTVLEAMQDKIERELALQNQMRVEK